MSSEREVRKREISRLHAVLQRAREELAYWRKERDWADRQCAEYLKQIHRFRRRLHELRASEDPEA